jgi:hypothetical protein
MNNISEQLDKPHKQQRGQVLNLEFTRAVRQNGRYAEILSVSVGSVAAAGNQILRVCFGVFIADGGS